MLETKLNYREEAQKILNDFMFSIDPNFMGQIIA